MSHTNVSESFCFRGGGAVNGSTYLGPGPEELQHLQGQCTASSHGAVNQSLILYK